MSEQEALSPQAEPTREPMETESPPPAATTTAREPSTVEEKQETQKETRELRNQSNPSNTDKLKAIFSDKRVIIGLVVGVVLLILIIGLAAGLSGGSSSSGSSSKSKNLALSVSNSGPVDLNAASFAVVTFQASLNTTGAKDATYYWNFSDGTQATSDSSSIAHNFSIDNSVLEINATVKVVTSDGTVTGQNTVSTYRLAANNYVFADYGGNVTLCTATYIEVTINGGAENIPNDTSIFISSDSGNPDCPTLIRKVTSSVVIGSGPTYISVRLYTTDASYEDCFDQAIISIDTMPESDQEVIEDPENAPSFPNILHHPTQLQSVRRGRRYNQKSLQDVTLSGPFNLKLTELADGGSEITYAFPDPEAVVIKLSGFQFDFNPKFYYYHKIDAGLQYAEASLFGEVDFSMLLQIELLKQGAFEKICYEQHFCGWLGCLVQIGPIPVVYQPFIKLIFGAKVDFNSPLTFNQVKMGIKGEIGGGLKYVKGEGLSVVKSETPLEPYVTVHDLTSPPLDCSLSFDVYDRVQVGIDAYRGLAELAIDVDLGGYFKLQYPGTQQISDKVGNAIVSGCSGTNTGKFIWLAEPYLRLGLTGTAGIGSWKLEGTAEKIFVPSDAKGKCLTAPQQMQAALSAFCEPPGPCVIYTVYSDPNCQSPFQSGSSPLNRCDSFQKVTCDGTTVDQVDYNSFDCSGPPATFQSDTLDGPADVCVPSGSNSYSLYCYDLCPE